MHARSLSFASLVLLVLSSCGSQSAPVTAARPSQEQGTPCASLSHAQYAGYTDGSGGRASQVQWFMSTCPPQTRDSLAAGYSEAYGKGAAEWQARTAQNAEAARQAETDRVQRICNDPAAAYQSGYNSGYRREPMSADWADHYCAAEARAGAKQQYIAGYQAGMAQAPVAPPPPPVVVVAPARGGTTALSTQESCRFNSDCSSGESCRHVHQLGHSVCMGDGLRGDYCWFDSDCGSDRCRIRSGGAKTCD